MTLPLRADFFFTKRAVWDTHSILPHYGAAPLPGVERLLSAMRLLLSDLRSWLKQDAVEKMLLLPTNMI